MDLDLRELERRARAGDGRARASLEREWQRRGLGWRGEVLPPGVQRGPERLLYVWDAGKARAVRVTLVPPGRLAAVVETMRPAADWPGPFLPVRHLEELEELGVNLVVFDLTRSWPLGQADLEQLVSYQTALASRGGKIVLTGISKAQTGVVRASGLLTRLDIAPTLEEAIARLQSPNGMLG